MRLGVISFAILEEGCGSAAFLCVCHKNIGLIGV